MQSFRSTVDYNTPDLGLGLGIDDAPVGCVRSVGYMRSFDYMRFCWEVVRSFVGPFVSTPLYRYTKNNNVAVSKKQIILPTATGHAFTEYP